jgi:hypothetical protein
MRSKSLRRSAALTALVLVPVALVIGAPNPTPPVAVAVQDGGFSVKSIKVVDTGDTIAGLALGPVATKTKFYWGFKVVIEGNAGGDITKAKVLKQELYMLQMKLPADPKKVTQYDLWTGEGDKKSKEITAKEFKDELAKYDSGKGAVTYAPDKDKGKILSKTNALVKLGANGVTYVDGPGYSDIGNAPALPAKDYVQVELYMKIKITVVGTDGKEVVAEFFRYQIGYQDETGTWVIPGNTKTKNYSDNTKLPLEKTP